MVPPVFLDFEASSLDLIQSYPIEVGICDALGNICSWLIAPAPLWNEWSAEAEQVHGISREELTLQGVNAQEVVEALNTRLNGLTVYCDAWTYDCFWLHRLYRACKTTPTFELESISTLLTPRQVSAWPLVRQQVIESLDVPTHRAANDARILYEVWKRLVSQPASN
ncbi:MAG: hypothetical protein D6758_01715 [Gammaproteobacteria bacterium]|nr:MAG: hypothetical protein D6758_01715 [Gammaproteobacteria bacterium]